MNISPLFEVNHIQKTFKKRDGQDLLVLDKMNFTVEEGEIIALLGKSGSGKSTLLRIMAGLIAPSSGDVLYRGTHVTQPVPGISMVFQSFALLPWLTVLQNVELGLEAQGMPRAERRTRAIHAIDVIGLDGFESAYPKELSGGMRQRVGFARALVVNPELLLMDEPFSALDVLTADNLRSDLVDLWSAKKTKLKGIVFVTHNIAEAVLIADRILIIGSNPGHVRGVLPVTMPHPRNPESAGFRQAIDDVYTLMTTATTPGPETKFKTIDLYYRLPKVAVAEITSFLEELNDPDYHGKKVDLPELADTLSLDIDHLLQITEVLEILRFAHVSKGDIELSVTGKQFAEAPMLTRKQIFAKTLLQYVPMARHIKHILDNRPNHTASENRFIEELSDYLTEDTAEEVLKVVIDWARYAEVFAYDVHTGKLSLENPE